MTRKDRFKECMIGLGIILGCYLMFGGIGAFLATTVLVLIR